MEVRDAGILHLATGRLVVCDPFWAPDSLAPFSVEVAPGRYPVTLSIARVDQPIDPEVPSPVLSVAAAKLTVVDQPVAGWELALLPGEDPTQPIGVTSQRRRASAPEAGSSRRSPGPWPPSRPNDVRSPRSGGSEEENERTPRRRRQSTSMSRPASIG